MSADRWAGWPPVEVWIGCVDGHLHTVRWEAGRLELVDHGLSDDPSAPCLALQTTWNRHADDLRVLTLAARDAAEALMLGAGPSGIPENQPPHHFSGTLPVPPWTLVERPRGPGTVAVAMGFVESASEPVVGADPLHDIGVLLHLGFGLGERLVAGVATTWADRLAADPDVTVPPALAAAVQERAERALGTWWGDGARVTVTADDPPSLVADPHDPDGAHLTVPVRWLADVWCRDVVVADDRFVLALDEARDDQLVVRAVDGDLYGETTVTVTLPVTPRTPDPDELGPATSSQPASPPRPGWDEEAAAPQVPFLVRQLAVSPAYGTLYLHSGFTDVHADHEDPYRAAHDDGVRSRRFIGVLDRALVDVSVPGYGQPDTPLTIEVWPHTPPDDIGDWDHEVDVDLDINGGLLVQGGGGGAEVTTTLPVGEFRARISGRDFERAARHQGRPEFRIRLWRRPRRNQPVLRRTWPGYETVELGGEGAPSTAGVFGRTPLSSGTVLRTDFSDTASWEAVRDAISAEAEYGYRADVRVVDDAGYDDANIDDVLTATGDHVLGFMVIVDHLAITAPDHPVLVVSLAPRNRGQRFRSLPSEIPTIDCNLSLANMDWEDFARAANRGDGTFRGF
jgi:hypothetical protein